MFARHAHLGMAAFWLFMAVVLLGGLMPDNLRAWVGEFRRVLCGCLAVGLVLYNIGRWWSYRAVRATPRVNPLAVRKIEPTDADYNPALDFNRPVVADDKPAGESPPGR